MEINANKLKRAQTVLSVLGVKSHVRIIDLLTSSGPMRVIDIAAGVGIRHANASRAVNRMRKADLLTNEQEGRNVFYKVKGDNCKRATRAIDLLAQ